MTTEGITLQSEVREVALFRRGAVVTREALLEGPGLPERVTLEGLPLSLDDGSVRARLVPLEAGDAEGEAKEAQLPRPIDVRVELALPRPGPPVEPADEEALRQSRGRLKELDYLLGRLDEADENLDRFTFELPQPGEDSPPPRVSPAVWNAAAAWVQKTKERRATRRSELRRRRRQELEAIAKLERRIARSRADQGLDEEALSKRVVVSLKGDDQSPAARLLVEYQVPGATWRPSYALRVSRSGREAQLSVRALVTQRSGEPWRRVRLSVSTADLRREVGRPGLESLRIGRRQPEPKRAWRPPPSGTELLFGVLDAALANLPSPGGTPADEQAPRLEKSDDDKTTVLAIPKGRRAAADQERSKKISPLPTRAPSPAKDQGFSEWWDKQEATDSPAEPAMDMFGSAMPAPSAPPSGASQPVSLQAEARSGGALAKLARSAFGGAPEVEASFEAQAGGAGAQAGSKAARLVVSEDLFDYPALRLEGWAPGGAAKERSRGRLRRQSPADRIEGLSWAQRQRLEELLLSAHHEAEALSPFPAPTTDIAQASGDYDYRYEAAGRVEVPGDGQVHSVPLFTRSGEVEITLVLVPRESEQAVRVATLDNPLDGPVLAGPADVYLDDEYLVTTTLSTTPTTGSLSVGLGVEEGLKAARTARYQETAQGLLGGSLVLEHQVELEVASRLASAAKVEVRERLPIIDEEDEKEIAFELGEVSPAWEDFEQSPDRPLKGGKRWRFDLEAGGQRRLSFSYTIRIDSKHELVGGNRRERG